MQFTIQLTIFLFWFIAVAALLAHALLCPNSYKGTKGAKLTNRFFLITIFTIIAEIITVWIK